MSKSNMIILGVLIIGIAVFAFIKLNGASKGGEVVNFEAELIDGSQFELSELKGNYVLLDFWGSWCPPCRAENPKLVNLYNKYKDESFSNADGFELITIALEKNDRTWKRAADKDGFTWKHQIVEQSKFVIMSPLARKFGVTDLPSKLLINPDGSLYGFVKLGEVDQILSGKMK